MENKRVCEKCGECPEQLYEFENETYCWDCLKWELEKRGDLVISTYEVYQNRELDYIGTNDDIDDIIKRICKDLDIEEIENE